MSDPQPDKTQPSKTQARKNWALFAVLFGFAVIMFAVTIIRFGSAGN